MTWNLNSFSSFEQYSFAVSFWRDLENNAPLTLLSSSPPWYFLQYHQRYTTHTTHASTPTTLPRWHTTNAFSPTIMSEVFNFQENERYKLRTVIHLPSRNKLTARFGSDTISSLGPKLRKLIPHKIKHASTLKE